MLSSRGTTNAESWSIPWRYASAHTYDAETNPTGTISLGMAEHASMRADIADYINTKVTIPPNSISYRPRPQSTTTPRLPKATATHLTTLLHPHLPITPDTIITANGATALGSMLGFALAEPNDGILVARPVYGRFELDYGVEAGVRMVYADTSVEEAFGEDVVRRYEEALGRARREGVRVRAVLVVNPHNPVGRCYPADTLKAILRFCGQHQLHLISDEVYASCIFDSGDSDAVPFTSVLAIDPSGLIDPNLVHLLYGFSKDFAAGGLHLGFLVTQNEPLRQACKAILRNHSASAPTMEIGATILEDRDFVARFTEKSCRDLASMYRIATSALEEQGIEYIRGGNAGFFVYIDLSPHLPDSTLPAREREFVLAERLLDAGVFLHPGEEHAKEVGWFRLVFSQEEDVLREGLRRMIGVLKTLR